MFELDPTWQMMKLLVSTTSSRLHNSSGPVRLPGSSLTVSVPDYVDPSELEDILTLPIDSTLQFLDSRLRTFVRFCARYHGECLGRSYL